MTVKMHPDPHVRINQLTGQTIIIKISLIIGKLKWTSHVKSYFRYDRMVLIKWKPEIQPVDAVSTKRCSHSPSRSMIRYFQVINSRQWVFFSFYIALQLKKENTVAHRLNRHWNQMARSWEFFKYRQISKGKSRIIIRLMSAWNRV